MSPPPAHRGDQMIEMVAGDKRTHPAFSCPGDATTLRASGASSAFTKRSAEVASVIHTSALKRSLLRRTGFIDRCTEMASSAAQPNR